MPSNSATASPLLRWIEQRSAPFFWITLAATAATKILFAALIPLTGDEALFAYWAETFEPGYFDHPPMTGWLPGLAFTLSKSLVMLRLPAILLTSGIVIAVYGLLKPYGEHKAALSATLLGLAPANLLVGIVHSTDVALIFFSVLAGIAYFKAIDEPRDARRYALTGCFMGLAFLSKYFVAMLGLAMLLHTLWRPSRKKIRGLALIVTCAAPFVVFNLWWNYNHCWTNIMHNFVNRVADAEVSWLTPVAFVASIAYLALPFAPALSRQRERNDPLNRPAGNGLELRFFAWFVIVPVIVLACALFFKDVRVHWLLAFYPFAFVALTPYLTPAGLFGCLKLASILSLLHLAAIVLALGGYDRILDADSKLYRSIVSEIHHEELARRLEPFRERQYGIFTTSAPFSGILRFYLGADVGLFGGKSFRGRQDDLRRDIKLLDGTDLLIIFRKRPELERYTRFFVGADLITLPVADTELYALKGQGFKYDVYRDDVIRRIIAEYYDVPDWLPMGDCYMLTKYGF
jgi:hypothetical protein